MLQNAMLPDKKYYEILNTKEEKYCKEEVKQICEFLKTLAGIEVEQIKRKEYEKSRTDVPGKQR